VQSPIEIADDQQDNDQEDAHHDHEDIGFTGRRDEGWQMRGAIG